MENLPARDSARASGWWLGQGAVGGLLGGAAFLAFEIAVAATTMGPAWTLFPLRLIGGIVMGPAAIDTASPIVPAIVAGLLVHVTLSAAFGVLLAALMQPVHDRATQRPIGATLAASAGYGFALWLVNVYVLAPLAGWEWFPRDTNPVVQFIAHALVYGVFVGSYLDRVETRQRAATLGEPVPAEVVEPRRHRRRPAA